MEISGKNRKFSSLLLLLHQPFRITDTTKFSINSLEELFEGRFQKNDGEELDNRKIFERIAKNSYIPTGQFLLEYLQKNPEFNINFTFSGTFLEQCRKYPQYGSQIIDIFQKLVDTGRVGIAGENYYHGVSHMYSWDEFGYQIDKQRRLIFDTFGVWPTFFRNTENKFNNEIAEFARLIGFQSIGAPGIRNYLGKDGIQSVRTIERPRFTAKISNAAISNNTKEFASRFISVAPIDHDLSNKIFFLNELQNIKPDLMNFITDKQKNFHLLFNDFEAFGEHNDAVEIDIYKIFSDFITMCNDGGIEFIKIDDIPSLLDLESKRYNMPFDVSSGNLEKTIESWRGNYYQEKAFILLNDLHAKAKQLYNIDSPQAEQLLDYYRKLTTSDHFYYIADLPGVIGKLHDMFSPYNSPKDAYLSYEFAIKFVDAEIDKYLASSVDK